MVSGLLLLLLMMSYVVAAPRVLNSAAPPSVAAHQPSVLGATNYTRRPSDAATAERSAAGAARVHGAHNANLWRLWQKDRPERGAALLCGCSGRKAPIGNGCRWHRISWACGHSTTTAAAVGAHCCGPSRWMARGVSCVEVDARGELRLRVAAGDHCRRICSGVLPRANGWGAEGRKVRGGTPRFGAAIALVGVSRGSGERGGEGERRQRSPPLLCLVSGIIIAAAGSAVARVCCTSATILFAAPRC